MNFNDAIIAHAEWKTRILRYIENHDGSLVPTKIEDDHACKLGAWIHGSHSQYKHLPEYDRLVTDHAVFHKQAALIIDKINNGEYVAANFLTHPDSPYVIASRNVIAAILEIRRIIGDVSLDTVSVPAETTPHETTPAFLKISNASPEITNIIIKSANQLADEIAILLKAYSDKPPSPSLINIIRESLLVSESKMFIEILESSKKAGLSSKK